MFSSCNSIPHTNVSEESYIKINCYNGTVCAIKSDGSLTMWGSNVFGGIGNGEIDNDDKVEPVAPYTHSFNESIIDAGSMVSSYALTKSGTLYVWGTNNSYECGTEAKSIMLPQQISSINGIKQFAMSTAFSLALIQDGTVYHAGARVHEFIDSEDYEWNYEDAEKNKAFTKLPLDFACENIYASVCSYVFLSDTSDVYIQGVLLGDPFRNTQDIHFDKPTKIDFPEKIRDVAALATNVVAVSDTGNVYVFGRPNSGLSNDKTDTMITELIYKKQISGIIDVDGNNYSVMALSKNGDCYAWGMNMYGLINESESGSEYELVPEPTKLPYADIKQISMGVSNGTALDSSGIMFIWGDNSIGQIMSLN